MSSATPTDVLAARPTTELRRPGSSRLASMKSPMCAPRTTAYAIANVRARLPNAAGTHSAASSRPAIATKITPRTASSSGSTTLVSQA